jgi:hypothetical protein
LQSIKESQFSSQQPNPINVFYTIPDYLEDIHCIREEVLHRTFPYYAIIPPGGLIVGTHLASIAKSNLFVIGSDFKVRPSLDPIILITNIANKTSEIYRVVQENPTCEFEIVTLFHRPTVLDSLERHGCHFLWKGRPVLNAKIVYWWELG